MQSCILGSATLYLGTSDAKLHPGFRYAPPGLHLVQSCSLGGAALFAAKPGILSLPNLPLINHHSDFQRSRRDENFIREFNAVDRFVA